MVLKANTSPSLKKECITSEIPKTLTETRKNAIDMEKEEALSLRKIEELKKLDDEKNNEKT